MKSLPLFLAIAAAGLLAVQAGDITGEKYASTVTWQVTDSFRITSPIFIVYVADQSWREITMEEAKSPSEYATDRESVFTNGETTKVKTSAKLDDSTLAFQTNWDGPDCEGFIQQKLFMDASEIRGATLEFIDADKATEPAQLGADSDWHAANCSGFVIRNLPGGTLEAKFSKPLGVSFKRMENGSGATIETRIVLSGDSGISGNGEAGITLKFSPGR